ncbi:hypothetical protein [Streptomyces purpurascens]|uniref:Uncharacterized protein n=1 Tax=Streptomyces purpurascens TaxID=1924 RepID=A0ABZ1M9J7_STREF
MVPSHPFRGAHRGGELVGGMAVRHWAEQANNVVRWSEFDHGGLRGPGGPDFLTCDIREFFRSLR